ncbi:MAG: DUF4398 domain-containing protein [Spirochaetaceae bacterium]|nr:DUF4398 domain-containing protein [Spirochaetaceae bacterium]
MIQKKNAIIIVVCFAALFVACAKPPVEDMDNAATAVARAESDVDVTAYAQGALSRARDSLNNMRTEAEAKRYEEARRLAAETVALAERAIQEGRNAAVRTRDEAANAISIMETAITEAGATIEGAKTARQKGVDFEEIEREFTDVKTVADRAKNANNEKRYREAIEGSSAVRSSLSGITGKIGQASITASRKK